MSARRVVLSLYLLLAGLDLASPVAILANGDTRYFSVICPDLEADPVMCSALDFAKDFSMVCCALELDSATEAASELSPAGGTVDLFAPEDASDCSEVCGVLEVDSTTECSLEPSSGGTIDLSAARGA